MDSCNLNPQKKMSKTIEVSDEMYNALMEISKEIVNQDNRCTAMPYIFQIQETVKVPAHDECGEACWYNHDCEQELRTTEEIIEWLKDDACEMDVHFPDRKEDLNFESLNDYELIDLIEEKGFDRFYEQKEYKYSNAFLTSKGCDNHIKSNGYHYENPVNYLSHAYRNPEIELIYKFLCGLSGKEIHK